MTEFNPGQHIQDIKHISLYRLEKEYDPHVRDYAHRKPYSDKPVKLKKLKAGKKDEEAT